MRRISRLLPLAVPAAVLLSAACAAPPTVDLAAEREALMQADRDWYEAYSTAEDPVAAFLAATTAEVVLLAPEAPLAEGAEAVGAVIGELEGMPGFSVSWSPDMSDVGSGGDLGYTRGTYAMSVQGPGGPMTINGKYLTIWKKQPDGRWMVVADMFNPDAPPPM
jgi:ketosteroid isomerase-like protein